MEYRENHWTFLFYLSEGGVYHYQIVSLPTKYGIKETRCYKTNIFEA